MSETPLPPLERIPPQIAAVDDYEAFARPRMTPAAFAYVSGGAADELTVRENVEAFRRLKLRTRVLRDVDGGDTRLELLGHELPYPILLAPVALQKLAHPEGELATALAAAAMRAPMIVSAEASVPLEDIAARAGQHTVLWMQLYLHGDRGFFRELVARVEAAGYRALVVTVDAPVSGARNREQRAEFALPPGIEAVNLRGSSAATGSVARAGESPVFGSGILAGAPTWKDIEWLRSITTLPVLVKGIMTPGDAATATSVGVAGVVVSNHGGRTLDTQPATIDVLESIAHAVDGRLPLLVDGGVRRGTDVLKALALGARAVLVGRPYVYALAAAGASGVAHVLHILRTELEMAMVLTGCRRLADIVPELVLRS
ncbi:MAG TPA: alpha-hydroxy acid oxidase [Gammaproteobacteria bacterium]